MLLLSSVLQGGKNRQKIIVSDGSIYEFWNIKFSETKLRRKEPWNELDSNISINIVAFIDTYVQGLLLKEYPNKLLATLIQCLFGAMQTCLVAAVAERGHPSRWKLGLDLSLIAVAYSVRAAD